jgi:hypothetical protein
MLPKKTPRQVTLIVNNVVKACQDIEKLNSTGYKYIHLASGFIAHYNINGFKGYYTGRSLRSDILANQPNNQWHNFKPGQENYEYYHQKGEIYNAICKALSA